MLIKASERYAPTDACMSTPASPRGANLKLGSASETLPQARALLTGTLGNELGYGMSVIAGRRAVISLGCSCQTAFQIEENADVFYSALGDGWECGSFFDWLITPSSGLSRHLDRGPTGPSLGEVSLQRDRPYFDGALLYHEYVSGPLVYEMSPGRDGQVCSKYGFLAQRFRELSAMEPLFVWSNSQVNLDRVAQEIDGLDLVLTSAIIDRVVTATETWLGKPAQFLFITSPGRSEVAERDGRISVRSVPLVHDWRGDTAAWRSAFESVLSHGSSKDPRSQQ